jgi:hypothetical protein
MRLRLLFAAMALFATQPAAAGIVAHYRIGQGPEQRMMAIEVNDRGDSRADLGDGRVMLLLDGTVYVVETDAEGTYAARAEDAFALSMEDWSASERPPGSEPSPDLEPLPPKPPPPPQVRLIRGGSETIAGRTGTVWRIHDPAAPAGASAEEFVVSADPDLAPLNNLLGPRRATAPDPALDRNGAAAARRAIYRRGAILRAGRHLRLERVEIRPMPGAFALPSPALSREALAARRLRTVRGR